MSIIFFRAKKGELIGDRFRLIDEIGEGSFGEVWLASRISDGREVALKIPKDQEKGEEVLRRESDIVKDIHHPNIVQVFGFHNISELFIIEMEYIDGYNLADVLGGINSQKPLSYKQMLEWTLQVLDGLASVHRAKISHNDLKPENILIERVSNTAKITDFGVSRRLEDVWVWTKRHGTEAYMAPEVALEGKRGRNVSDIYSIGVLLYEMTTGSLPYTSPHQLLTGASISKPREINRDISVELESIILKAMERRPERRYPDTESMREDVKDCLASLRQRKSEHDVPVRATPTKLAFRPPSSSPLFYLELAKQRLAEDNPQEALEAAEAAVNRSDDHPQYIKMLGGICLRLGYYQKAINAYEKLLATYNRGYPVELHQKREVIERLGQLYIQKREYNKAIDIYKELVALWNTPYSRFRFAIAVGLDGDYPRAIELLEEVRDKRSDAVIVYSKLGWAHALNGDDRLALSFYNQALAMDAFDLFSLFQLGQYYHMIGDKRRSKEYFQRVLEADRSGDYAVKVRELVEEPV